MILWDTPIGPIAYEMINEGSEPLVCLVIRQGLTQDISNYPRKSKGLFRHGGARNLVDIANFRDA